MRGAVSASVRLSGEHRTYLRAQGYGVNEPNGHDAKKVTLTSLKIPYQAT
jgi:hypothetical protein